MLEARTFVKDIDGIKKSLEKMDAVFKGEYVCRDNIYIPKHTTKPYGEEFLRLRVNEKNIWKEKDVILSIKQVQKKEIGKNSLIPFRKEFDSEEEGRRYLEENFSKDFIFDFEFTRTGWQYNLGEDQIDLERVENVKNLYTVEIKSKTVEGLKKLAEVFKLDSFIRDTMVSEMKKRVANIK